MEALLERGFRSILRLSGPCSVEDDFFKQLGGDSLSAALLVTLLRDDSLTAWVTVRDIYEARTIAGLARRASAAVEPKTLAEAPSSSHRQGHPLGNRRASVLALDPFFDRVLGNLPCRLLVTAANNSTGWSFYCPSFCAAVFNFWICPLYTDFGGVCGDNEAFADWDLSPDARASVERILFAELDRSTVRPFGAVAIP